MQAQKLSRNLEPVSIYENKSRKNGAGEKSKREGQGQRGNGEGERAREVTQILFKADQEDTKCQPKKKVCNRDINSQRNIIFIYEYCQHAEVYKLWHKTVFWNLIRELRKEQTRYNFSKLKITVTPWVSECIDKFLDSEMAVAL